VLKDKIKNEKMRHNHLYSTAALLVLALVFVACKKEVNPRLIVNVTEEDGSIVKDAIVHAWFGSDAGRSGSTLNDKLMDQTGYTDAAGDAIFDFQFSAVLDIDVVYYKDGFDTLTPPNPTIDTLYGHRVVLIESVRQKSKENNYNETVVIK
jgi:hypothetical protein